ncbi:MAG: hypothetical protein DRH70_03720 [Candidatus Coatesbacteria bacterium]|nr:MAG: hypothetical protein DRH70_03720 [Candidatus Coatesbacteria bacterium]
MSIGGGMMGKMSVTEALKKVLDDEHWMRKTLLGGVLLWIPVLFFFPKGYLMQLLRAAIRRETDRGLPTWSASESFILGAKAFAIWVLYYVLPALFLWLAHLNRANPAYSTLLTIGIVLAVLSTLFLPWGAAVWLSTGSVRSAFDIRRLLKVFGFLGEYLDVFVRCLLLVVFSAGMPFAGFFAAMACMQLLGEVTGRYVEQPEAKD